MSFSSKNNILDNTQLVVCYKMVSIWNISPGNLIPMEKFGTSPFISIFSGIPLEHLGKKLDT